MITSSLTQLHWYRSISPNFAKAIDFVLAADFGPMETGRHDIDGENAFVIVNEYHTKSAAECEPEAHIKYADIQIMITGTENFGYTALTNQDPAQAYDADRDVAFYAPAAEDISYIRLTPGQFIIFFPSDIHQPEVFHRQPALVKKVVVKVRVA